MFALAGKDASELLRNPGAIVPAVVMVFGALVPAFLVIVGVPMIIGETFEESGEFASEAAQAVGSIPELAGLSGNALVQTFLFHQFSLLLLLVPTVAAMALATHAVIGEKQSKALEPILATPISTLELLVAKTLTPFVLAVGLSWAAVALYVLGAFLLGEPGVGRAVAGPRLLMMFGLVGPLVALTALLLSVIVSSRSNDPRSAQQITGLMILPISGVFVAQLMGAFVIGPTAMLAAAAGFALVDALLFWVGVRVFARESILTRWR